MRGEEGALAAVERLYKENSDGLRRLAMIEAKERMEYLVNQGMMAEALDLGREFHEWMRAPLEFDHNLDYLHDS